MAESGGLIKILFLLPFAPRLDAAHGGGRVTAQFIEAIATHHQVAIAYLRGVNEPPLDDTIREKCEFIEEVSRPFSGDTKIQRWARNARLIASLLHLNPLWVTDWSSKAFGERVREIANAWQPDIVQIEFHVMGQYIPYLNGTQTLRVLTVHEPGIRSAPYIKNIHPIPGYFIHKIDKMAWKRYEPKALRNVHAAVVFTESDKKALKTLHIETPIYKIPIGTAIPETPLSPLGCQPNSLLFFGSFIHPPNAEAALRLANQIFPIIKKRFPDLKLYIVGDQPPLTLRRLADKDTFITGRVPDLTPYLNRAAVIVAPLTSGGGMRVKILDALAAGKAIVATTLSIEGLDLTDGDQIYVADGDREIAERIIRLISDPEQRIALARRARLWACRNLHWDKPVKAYEDLYQNLLSRARA